MESLRQKPVTELFKSAKRLKKDPSLSRAGSEGKKLRIAVLSSYSIQHFSLVLNLFLDNAGIAADILEGEYGGINMAGLDENSGLYSSKPDIVLILMRYTDISYSESCVKETMDQLCPGSTWSCFGVGHSAMEIMYAAIALGGNIRVGMEDNVMYAKGQLAESNRQLIERAARVIREFGCEVATPDEARQILGLK